MIRAAVTDHLPIVTGMTRHGGVPVWTIRHVPTFAVIDDEAPIGEHVMFMVAGDGAELFAERVADLLATHGLVAVPDDAEGLAP